MVRKSLVAIMLPLLIAAACAPERGAPPAGPGAPTAGRAQPARTLVMAGRAEPPSLSSKPMRAFGLTPATVVRLFNAGLAVKDDKGLFRPQLAEALPQLNTDSWRVFPDGRMETTYHLRPNVAWHDGRPLTGDDFVFSFELYGTPELGHAASAPIGLMEEVLAPDPRSVVIRWKRPYFEAGSLEAGGGGAGPSFPALPRHLLEESFRQAHWDTFVAHPYWSVDFIGTGPFKLDRWEPGAFFEAVAFDAYALGRPRIERIRMLFIPDFNTTVANMLGGEAHITVDDSIRFQQGMILKREWAPRNAGTVLVYPTLWRWTIIQQRPEYANPRSLLDARVRQALAHSVDKQALADALFEGEGIMTESPVPPTADHFALVDRASAKYPYDLRRTEQLMADTGFARGRDGIWAQGGLRFSTDLAVFQSPQNESEMAIMAATWRQTGFDIKEIVWPAVAASDAPLRNMHPGLSSTGGSSGDAALVEHNSAEIPRPENRWSGSNRGGWSNPEFDRLAATFNASLDRNERVQALVQMARIFTEDAAVISLYFNPTVTAFVAGLTGPVPVVPDGSLAWNIHEWEFRR